MSSLYFDAGPSASGQKVCLATTAYDSPDASYTFSIARSREALHRAGIPTAYLLLTGNCHVDDARNTVVRDFLASDCTDLVFLDADVSWEPEDLIRLCRHDLDLVGGVYPYRRDDGGESMPYRPLPDASPDADGILEVEGLPTGFLRIRRPVLEAMAEGAASFIKDGDGRIPVLFERDLYGGHRRGGDINFCMKWRAMGGRLYAASELRLGHCGKQVIRDSLAASLRRRSQTTLRHVAGLIREGRETPGTYAEVLKAIGNPWGAGGDVLALAVGLARRARGPILEAGSGLTTILMAAANPDQRVWTIEHSGYFAGHLETMARQAGVSNISIVHCDLLDGWYDLREDDASLPERFAVGLVDGPPRALGDRMRFFDLFGARTEAILADDADEKGYAAKLGDWARAVGRTIQIDGRAAVILKGTA